MLQATTVEQDNKTEIKGNYQIKPVRIRTASRAISLPTQVVADAGQVTTPSFLLVITQDLHRPYQTPALLHTGSCN